MAAVEPSTAAAGEAAQEAVRIANSHGRQAGGCRSAGGVAITHRGVCRHLPHLHHLALQAHDGPHRIGPTSLRGDAIEGCTRADEIEVVLRSQEDPGRGRQAHPAARQSSCHLLKQCELSGIGRMI